MAQGERLTIIIDKDIKDNLFTIAEHKNTTVSKFVRRVIEDSIRKELRKIK